MLKFLSILFFVAAGCSSVLPFSLFMVLCGAGSLALERTDADS